MLNPPSRARATLGPGVAYCAVAVVLGGAPVLAERPAPALPELHHTAWRLAEGAPPAVWALAQTADGYLWLGTGSGLYRFDGLRFEPWRANGGASLAQDVISLAARPDGALWMGFQHGGAASLIGGRVSLYTAGLPRGPITVTADPAGGLWAYSTSGYAGTQLSRFEAGAWRPVDRSRGLTVAEVRSVAFDGDGSLWLASADRVLKLAKGAPRFQDAGALRGRPRLLAASGRVWVSEGRGLRLLSGRPGDLARVPGLGSVRAAIIDRSGTFWASTSESGVARVARPFARPAAAAETFGLERGLSSNLAWPLLEDREGAVWVGTNLGLDRFRSAAVALEPSISTTSDNGYRAQIALDGALYLSDSARLVRVDPSGTARVLALQSRTSAMCARRDGAVVVASSRGLVRWTAETSSRLPPPRRVAAPLVLACQEDGAGRLWVSFDGLGLFRLDRGGWRAVPLGPDLQGLAPNLIARTGDGAMWLYFEGLPLMRWAGGRLTHYGPATGLNVGALDGLQETSLGLLVSGDEGLARLERGRFHSLGAEAAAPFSRATGIVETAHETWFNGLDGVTSAPKDALRALFVSGRPIARLRTLGTRDGLPGLAQQDSYSPTAAATPDGRLWFLTSHGVARLDTRRPASAAAPGPAQVQEARLSGRMLPLGGVLRLPERPSNLELRFTALSLSAPEALRFRYRLDGVDRNWVDAGERREVSYPAVPPGRRLFHLSVRRDDQTWGADRTPLTIETPAAFTQTPLFDALLLVAAGALAWGAYALRLRQVAARLRLQLQERVGERERIARELHDTLLQGCQGLVLRFQAVSNQMPRSDPLAHAMEQALERAEDLIVEGRERIRDLRTREPEALAEALAAVGERLGGAGSPRFRVVVEGVPRALHPIVREEALRIGAEAVSNAFRHAEARSIDAVVAFERRVLRLWVHDDGRGLPPDASHSKHGFGLVGIRERAARMRGRLTISTGEGAGTDVELTVPARLAYAPTPSAREPAGGSVKTAAQTAS